MRAERRSFLSATIGTTFWGLSGTAAQALFQNYGFPVAGLVTIRMLLAGSILILILRPALPRKSPLLFAALSVLGIAGSQVTYLAAIQASNATTATILQFLFLPMVVVYEAATGALRLSKLWVAMLALVAVGTLLLVGGASPAGFELLVSPLGGVVGAPLRLHSRLLHARFEGLRPHGRALACHRMGLLGRRVSLPSLRGGIAGRLPPSTRLSCLDFGDLLGRGRRGPWHVARLWIVSIGIAPSWCQRGRDCGVGRTDSCCGGHARLSRRSAGTHTICGWGAGRAGYRAPRSKGWNSSSLTTVYRVHCASAGNTYRFLS